MPLVAFKPTKARLVIEQGRESILVMQVVVAKGETVALAVGGRLETTSGFLRIRRNPDVVSSRPPTASATVSPLATTTRITRTLSRPCSMTSRALVGLKATSGMASARPRDEAERRAPRARAAGGRNLLGAASSIPLFYRYPPSTDCFAVRPP